MRDPDRNGSRMFASYHELNNPSPREQATMAERKLAGEILAKAKREGVAEGQRLLAASTLSPGIRAWVGKKLRALERK